MKWLAIVFHVGFIGLEPVCAAIARQNFERSDLDRYGVATPAPKLGCIRLLWLSLGQAITIVGARYRH